MTRRVLLLLAAASLPALGLFVLLGWLEVRDDRAAPPAPDSGPRTRPALMRRIDRGLGSLLRPGALAASHAELEGVLSCLRCHGRGRHVPDSRCLVCHEEITARATRELPLHGQLEGSCMDCHPDHRGADAELIELDREAFSHATTRYPLRGAHAEVKCESCHTLIDPDRRPPRQEREPRFRYQGVPFDGCIRCHTDPHGETRPEKLIHETLIRVSLDGSDPLESVRDPERPLADRSCEDCHTDQSFRAAHLRPDGFRHDEDTHFPLEGAHREVRCDGCHTPALRDQERAAGERPGAEAETDCGGCHEDPHKGALTTSAPCTDCHSALGWEGGFDHTRNTRFELDPLHERLACTTCHADLRFRSEGRECADCHRDAAELLAGRWSGLSAQPDPHGPALECQDCHGPTLEANRPAALAARCAECHAPSYATLLATWRAQLDSLAARSARAGGEVERLRHSGPHHFALARELLSRDEKMEE
ncbi:MAG: cytochrome c3 family protein [Myxococcota bacterium]